MIPVSIVVITKNEGDVIEQFILKAKEITDDIVIVDTGSTDDTRIIARNYGCHVYNKSWQSYGANKNIGNDLAKYNWVLSLDADELPDNELINSLHNISYDNPKLVYDIKFCSYFGNQQIRFGNWGKDHHIRLFNREWVKWADTLVHEKLILDNDIKIKHLKGRLHHFTTKDFDEYHQKSNYYAKLCAEKYFKSGKRSNILKICLSPIFGFIKSYVILLGFLDGYKGWLIAKSCFINTMQKYIYLKQMKHCNNKNFI